MKWRFWRRRPHRHMYFYIQLSTMIAALDGYSLAGWEFVAWIDPDWTSGRLSNGEKERAALFRRAPSGP